MAGVTAGLIGSLKKALVVWGSWVNKTSLTATKNYTSFLTYQNGMFLAPQYNVPGTPAGNYGEAVIQTTSDGGTTWNARTLPSVQQWRFCRWNGTYFVLTTDGTAYATSTDGVTWTARTLAYGHNYWGSVFAAGLHVLGCYGEAKVVTSPDGLTWTERTGTSASAWAGMEYGAGIYLNTADTSGVAQTSPDGITWTARTMPAFGNHTTVAWNGSLFVSVTTGSTNYATSPDGITWTARTLPITGGRNIVAGNGSFIVQTDGSSTNASITSPDGITWTARTVSQSADWGTGGAAFGAGVFLATSGTDNKTAAITCV